MVALNKAQILTLAALTHPEPDEETIWELEETNLKDGRVIAVREFEVGPDVFDTILLGEKGDAIALGENGQGMRVVTPAESELIRAVGDGECQACGGKGCQRCSAQEVEGPAGERDR